MSDQPNDQRERHPNDEFEQRAETDRAAARTKREADAKAAKDKAAADAQSAKDAEAAKAASDTEAERTRMTEEEAAERLAATRGAQVVLDPESPAAIAAKGGAGRTMHENTEARDAALIEMGHDPAAPSAHLTDPLTDEQRAARGLPPRDPNAPQPIASNRP